MFNSQHQFLDTVISQFDQALKTLVPGSVTAGRVSPGISKAGAELEQGEQQHSAGLMRSNHTGEVCAQALYQGQALTARLPVVREQMQQAANEEVDHLSWCEDRLEELHSRPSLLNPVWYAMSYGLGAAAGLAGDKWSLGFVAETEHQVCEHLQDHLHRLPRADEKSRAILERMLVDEGRHAIMAENAGASKLPQPVRQIMTLMSEIMKKTAYRL